jgi:hypothetical protein
MMESASLKKTAFTYTGDAIEEFADFLRVFRLDDAASGRYSDLLALQMFGGWKAEKLDPRKIIYEIKALEGTGRASQTKAPIRNTRPPLKGLWHKHYQGSGLPALAKNIQRALNQYGVPSAKRKVREAQRSGQLRYFSEEDIKEISREVAQDNYSRLGRDAAVTGEWLLFATHQDQNYYLSLATHDENTHAETRRQIDAICCKEYPFLLKLLAQALTVRTANTFSSGLRP